MTQSSFIVLISTFWLGVNPWLPAVKAQTIPPAPPTIPAVLTTSCKSPDYTPVDPQPDKMVGIWSSGKRYRLVIGAGEYAVSPEMNRTYVDATAELVDQKLGALGYDALPDLPGKRSFIAGKDATKQSVMDALRKMVKLTQGNDRGVIYYVGHGQLTPSNKDLSLGVYDRPVAPDEGIRFSDILGTLEVSEQHDSLAEIPHYLIVLDSCLSGNVALGSEAVVIRRNNVDRVYTLQNLDIPEKITLLTATTDGDLSEAYDLKGSTYSAFGFFFARALGEDWACADANSPDGVLTVNELKVYLNKKLNLAFQNHATGKLMRPMSLDRDKNLFVAFDPSKHHDDGIRGDFVDVSIQPNNTTVSSTLRLPNGASLKCDGTAACTFPVSKSLLAGIGSLDTVTEVRSVQYPNAAVHDDGIGAIAGVGASGGKKASGPAVHKPIVLTRRVEHDDSADFNQLMRYKSAVLSGATISIK